MGRLENQKEAKKRMIAKKKANRHFVSSLVAGKISDAELKSEKVGVIMDFVRLSSQYANDIVWELNHNMPETGVARTIYIRDALSKAKKSSFLASQYIRFAGNRFIFNQLSFQARCIWIAKERVKWDDEWKGELVGLRDLYGFQ